MFSQAPGRSNLSSTMHQYIEGQNLLIKSNHCVSALFQKLSRFRADSQFVDAVVVVASADCQIVGHKLILACCSPYFEARFTTPLQDPTSGDMVTLQAPFLTHEGVRSVIDYFYSGSLRITPDTVQGILAAVDLLLLDETRKVILNNYLPSIIDRENCITCKRLGDLYGCQGLVDAANNFIMRNFSDIWSSDPASFCQQVQQVDELESWLDNPSLRVPSEELLLDLIDLWCSSGERDRSEESRRLLGCIRWQSVPDQMKLKYSPVPSVHPAPRKKEPLIVAVGFDANRLEVLDMGRPDLTFGHLTSLPLRYGLNGASMTSFDDHILLTGGVLQGKILTAVPRFLLFNWRSNVWRQAPPMLFPRKRHSSVVHKGWLWVIGGHSSSSGYHSIEKILLSDWSFPTQPLVLAHKESAADTFFASSSPFWTEGVSFSSACSDYALVSAAGNLYAFARYHLGFHPEPRDSTALFSDWIFCEQTKSWSQFESRRLVRDRATFAACGHGRLVVAVGGREIRPEESQVPSKLTELFDPTTNEWTRIPDLVIGREFPGVVSIGSCVYVIGGKMDSTGGLKGVETFQIGDASWILNSNLVPHFQDQEYFAALINLDESINESVNA